MPPLRHWLVGIGLSSVTGYFGYNHIYIPRVYHQEPLERQWEQERSHVQQLWQQLILLEKTAPKMVQIQKRCEDVSTRHVSACIMEENQKKLSLFYALQKARFSLFDVLTSSNPIIARSISFSQAIDYLQRIERLQMSYCTPLSFRPDSPTMMQKVRYVLSLFLYLFTFEIIPTVLPSSFLNVNFFHFMSKCIILTLEIPCSMTICDKRRGEECKISSSSTYSKEKMKDMEKKSLYALVKQLQEQPSSLKIVLPSQHWIENVGFWACENNPLLFSGLDFPTVRKMIGRNRIISYQKWWETMFSQFPPVKSALKNMEKASYTGYPVAVNCERVTPDSPVVPVVVTGLPSLLYAGKVKTPGTQREGRPGSYEGKNRYAKVVEQQYQSGRASGRGSKNIVWSCIEKEKEKEVSDPTGEKNDLDSPLYMTPTPLKIRDILGVSFPFVYGNTSQRHYKLDVLEGGLNFCFGQPQSSERDLLHEIFEAWKRKS